MSAAGHAHKNIALDDFLVTAGDRAPTVLHDLLHIPLTDKRFRFIARTEARRTARPNGEQISAKEALKQARADLEFLVQEAEEDSENTVREVLEYPNYIRAFALVANRDRSAFEVALLRLRTVRVKDRDVKALEKAVNAERRKPRLRVMRPDDERARPTVRSILPDAPVPDDAVVPVGWGLGSEGVRAEHVTGLSGGAVEPTRKLIAPAPIVISRRYVDITDHAESVQLNWHRDGRWQKQIVGRAVVANARHLVELAGVGLPVTSITARELVRYLSEFEAENLAVLPKAHVSRQMGWIGEDGKLGFLWGHTLIRPNGEQAAAVNIEALAKDWREDFVAFHGADSGDEQLAGGFYGTGTYTGWLQAVTPVAAYPRVILALYASLTPVLLPILDAPNFCVDWCGLTTQGKTTTLRVGASVWGCPNERAPRAALGTWDATRVWIERASAVLNNLPLILDDTKRAKHPRLIAQTLYDVTSGRGRGRGSPQGISTAGSWATVGLFSGEAPAVSFTEDGGTRARVLTLWGPPFGTTDGTTALMVDSLNRGLLEHYGHAGPQFVAYVVRQREQWQEWRTAYQIARAGYLDKAEGNPIAGRIAAYLAALDLTAVIAHRALELPWRYRDPIAPLWDSLTREASEADRAAVALSLILSWATGHEQEFWGRHRSTPEGVAQQPPAGWAGKWDKGEQWTTIAFLPHKLRELLKLQGFDPEPVLRLWRDRDWLEVSEDHARLQKKISLGGDKPWAVVIKREAVTQAAGDKTAGGADEEPATESSTES